MTPVIQYPLGVGELQTRVLEAGTTNDDCVLMIHGVGARADRFRPNVEAFAAQGCRAVAVDLPGHGLATKDGDLPYSAAFFADFALRSLDALGIEAATLVGTSLGGHIAALAALQEPRRVPHLVLVGAMGLVPTRDVLEPIAKGLTDRSREAVRAKLHRVQGDPSRVTEDWVEEEWRIANSPGAAESLDALADYIAHRQDAEVCGDRLGELPESTTVLLVWGEDDVAVPVAAGYQALEVIPRARLALLRGAGHGPYYEREEAFTELVMDELRGTASSERIRRL